MSTDRSAANADNKETITVTLTPRDSHNNVVPLWTFRKDLTIVPSVNATVPGAVTVTAPAQDATGNVAATLTYVDTSSKLLSKEARAGTTTIAVGKAVKQTVDTRFYPRVHVCVSNLSGYDYIVPGHTVVQICDGSNTAVPSGSGYTVTRPGLSSAGCTKSGGGVCPPDTAGVKADFTGLTGDDIAELVFHPKAYEITDDIANVNYESDGPRGKLAYYGELATHFPAAPLGGSYGRDIFHVGAANGFCRRSPDNYDDYSQRVFREAIHAGDTTGGRTNNVQDMQSLFIGDITGAIHTGGDTNPELFVSGGGVAFSTVKVDSNYVDAETVDTFGAGAKFPHMLVMVNGKRAAAVAWTMLDDGLESVYPHDGHPGEADGVVFARWIAARTGWNLSDMYFVNNWPGTPVAQHKADENDTANMFVTQVNYVSGYICAASLH
ncbi:hypothetical protein OP103_004705 [Salmonella enterica subsp. enterica]|nr:hypothetical protein [Salmonella enterica subsp. enterica]EKC4662286.1 hypothetical protein [Salmonella enterica subsp. enterica]